MSSWGEAVRIAGNAGDNIQNILGIEDFNGDGRNDFAVGAPTANNGQGRVYIAYRREEAVEDDFVLSKLDRDPSDPERLDGMLIMTNSLDGLGSSLATGVDFNGDERSDLVIGSPKAAGGVGEVIILFSNTGIVSPMDGFPVGQLLEREGQPVAARITGNPLDADGQFGFNVANAGDIDGDDLDDLLISAPNASPRFDSSPTDLFDELTEPGVDVNFDGLPDDVSGLQGIPDGLITAEDELRNAGIVYVISGTARLDQLRTCADSGKACVSAADCGAGESCLGSTTISIDQLGTSQLPGFMIVGRRPGDRLGGGDAGDTAQGGNQRKAGRGRSYGLAPAGDVDGDGRADILIGSILANPRLDPVTADSVTNGGEAYLVYGSAAP